MRTSIKITLFVVFFMAVAGIGLGIYLYNLKPADLKHVKPAYTVTAQEIQNEFNKDEAGATNKYVNKVIEVTGLVNTVLSGEGNTYNLSLKTGSYSTFVICSLEETEGYRRPNVGEIITIRGICSGFLMDILMNNCVIIVK